MKIIEVTEPDDVLNDVKVEGVCEVGITCYGAPIGYCNEDFLPFYAITDGPGSVPVLLCEDCHGFLQDAYGGAK